jgi:hypothetical protein
MTSFGIGAAPEKAMSHASRPTIARSGLNATSSTNDHCSASSVGSSLPAARSCCTSRPIRNASAKRCWSSCGLAATAAWMPAVSFSQMRGGPNRIVGLTAARYCDSWLMSGHGVTSPPHNRWL